MLLRSDELATMLGADERYQKSRRHQCRPGAHAGAVRRRRRAGSIAFSAAKMFVKNWSAVPVGHIQPAKVRQLVGGLSDDGLLQRFMLVMPPRIDVS